jgi:hypothetical protein
VVWGNSGGIRSALAASAGDDVSAAKVIASTGMFNARVILCACFLALAWLLRGQSPGPGDAFLQSEVSWRALRHLP